MTPRRLLDAGDSGVLVELDDLDQVISLNRALSTGRPHGVFDVIPAARTVLVRFEPESISRSAVSDWLSEAEDLAETAAQVQRSVLIPVRYDGEDLADVATLCGLTAAEVVALHTSTEYTVAFCGFAPGFAYLTGSPAALRVPRRTSPRKKVPAGAVALADEFSGIYPTDSPGGWQLIGRTNLVIFDLNRDPPASLTPGTRIRFVEVTQ